MFQKTHRISGALMVGLFALVGTARGQEISWVAVGADGPFILEGANAVGEPTRIALDAGVAYRVEFEIRINGWGNASGSPTLGTYQATLDAAGLLGANADPPNPGVDLLQINEPPYGGYTGAFIRTRTCNDIISSESTGQRCDELDPPLPPCPAGTVCGDNPDYVFTAILHTSAVATPTANYAWAAFSQIGVCRTDEGGGYYAGTFLFDVPPEVRGVYEFGFDPNENRTFLNDCNANLIEDVTLTPGSVAVITGACCTFNFITQGWDCESDVSALECLGVGDPQHFWPGEACSDPGFECVPCASDQECNDLNACTDDVCNHSNGRCQSTLNYDPVTQCCDPQTGNLLPLDETQCCDIFTGDPEPLDDGDVCTEDYCDPDGHGTVHDPLYDIFTECCNPLTGVIGPYDPATECCTRATGEVEPIDDQDPCTNDSCLLFDGVIHDPSGTAGLPCDDSLPCTADDVCDGLNSMANGGCAGHDVNGDACTTDTDCPVGACDTGAGMCKCIDITPQPAPYPHDRLKNRYISFAPVKDGAADIPVAFQIDIKSIAMGSCSGPDSAPCRYEQGSGNNEAGDADCKRCSSNNNPCINAAADCVPNTQSCNLSGETCSNDDPASAASNIGLIRWVGPADPVHGARFLAVTEAYREERLGNDWPDVVHVGDCEIVPQAVYGIRAFAVGSEFESGELIVATQPRPANGVFAWWGDSVGSIRAFCNGDIRTATCNNAADCGGDPCVLAYTAPDGFQGFDDINATLLLFVATGSNPVAPGAAGVPINPSVPDITWTDMYGEGPAANFNPPNGRATFSDIGALLAAFSGRPYPYSDPADCPDVGEWP